MADRAPELVLLVGLVLGTTALATGLAFGAGPGRSILLFAIGCYPFAAYAIHHDDDPAAILLPRVIVGLGAIAGVIVFVDSARRLPSTALVYAFSLALVVWLPPTAYGARYGTPPAALTPWIGAATGLLVGAVALVANAVLGGPPAGAIAGGLLIIAGLRYGSRRGPVIAYRRRLIVPIGSGFAVVLLALGIWTAGPLDSWLAAAVVSIAAPAVGYATTIDAVR